MMTRNVVSTLICLAVVSSMPFMAAAQGEPERDWARERVIVAELEAISPESVASFESATKALDGGDFERAAIDYRAVLEAVPDYDPALRRLGGAYSGSGARLWEVGKLLEESDDGAQAEDCC